MADNSTIVDLVEDFSIMAWNIGQAKRECSKVGKVYEVTPNDLIRFECQQNMEAPGFILMLIVKNNVYRGSLCQNY